MNILWTTNITLPSIAEQAGLEIETKEGWLTTLANSIINEHDVRLCVVSFAPSLKEPLIGVCNKIYYYIIPTCFFIKKNNDKLRAIARQIDQEFNPNLMHINGTEYGYALQLLPLLKVQSVISIQGLVSVCSRFLFTGFSFPYLFKHPLFLGWLYRNFTDYVNRGKNEIKYFNTVGHAVGRTEWDKVHVKQINPQIIYHHCDESMRPSFFKEKWDIHKIIRHQIYISQASYQIKGLHLILDAIAELKVCYPDLRVVIAGKNPLQYSSSLSERIKSHFDYGYYLKSLMKKKGLMDTICFVGNQKEEDVARLMLQSHVTIVPSTIENSPNSMCEAQCLGLPCVASYVGGTPDLSENGTLSPLYRCEEWEMLVEHIRRIFDSDDYAQSLSERAREVAIKRNSQKNNSNVMAEIYRQIINQETK